MAEICKFIDCPACGKLMKKIYLEEQDIIVDICLDGCGGIWFDNRELAKVDEKHEDILPITEAKKDKDFESVDVSLTRFCPHCKVPMVKNYVSAKKEIVIDECYTCGGKFFDHKELEAMRNQYDTNEQRVEDIRKLASDSVNMQLILENLLND